VKEQKPLINEVFMLTAKRDLHAHVWL